jgi:hypothetical protein
MQRKERKAIRSFLKSSAAFALHLPFRPCVKCIGFNFMTRDKQPPKVPPNFLYISHYPLRLCVAFTFAPLREMHCN